MEADQLRAIADAHLPLACTVSAVTNVADGSGGFTPSQAVKETTRCGLTGGVMVGDITADIAAKLQGRNAYRYRLPASTKAAIGDLIVSEGSRFEILSLSRAPGATAARGLAAEA